jgi:hypothetical protein
VAAGSFRQTVPDFLSKEGKSGTVCSIRVLGLNKAEVELRDFSTVDISAPTRFPSKIGGSRYGYGTRDYPQKSHERRPSRGQAHRVFSFFPMLQHNNGSFFAPYRFKDRCGGIS